jgi:hypothetical protein
VSEALTELKTIRATVKPASHWSDVSSSEQAADGTGLAKNDFSFSHGSMPAGLVQEQTEFCGPGHITGAAE